jgi:hypothetical protein
MAEEFVAAVSPWTAATAPKTFKPKCAGCRLPADTPFHKFSCGLAWFGNPRYPLHKRKPGLSIDQPDRAHWPEVAHAKRTKQYRHPRST